MSYAIKTPIGYVMRWNQSKAMVQVTDDPQKAKRWPTIASATIWLHTWADRGFGLSSKTANVENVE